MSRTILWIVVGMIIMYILLRIASSGTVSNGSNKKLLSLLGTQQVANLTRTNEFREVVKTNEFKSFIATLAKEQTIAVARVLTGVNVNVL